MVNSQFRILCESLGLYTAKSIVVYLNQFDDYVRIAERVADYWLKGKKFKPENIPEDIQNHFINLKHKQLSIVARERNKSLNKESCTFQYIFKDPIKMWSMYPELEGLPVSFLNQIVIRLDLNLDYFENNEEI